MIQGRSRQYYRKKLARTRRQRFRGKLRLGQGRSFAHRVKGLINGMQEKKFIDTIVSDTTSITGTSVITPLTLVAQGDDVGQRDGDEIRILTCGFNMFLSSDLNNVTDTVNRIIIFRAMKNVDGVLPTVGEILVADCITSFYNQDNRGDFQIIYDSFFKQIIPNHAAVDVERSRDFKQWATKFAIPGKKCSYDLGTAVIAAAEKGHLFMIRMTTAATTFQPTWNMDIRCLYVD